MYFIIKFIQYHNTQYNICMFIDVKHQIRSTYPPDELLVIYTIHNPFFYN